MMIFKHFFLVLALICLVGCSSGGGDRRNTREWMTYNGKLKVLSTTAMIDDLVKGIGGSHVDTTTLIKGDLDPHSYQLVKGDDEKLAFSDLIFYNGLGLEHGPTLQLYLKKQKKAIPLGDKIVQNNSSSLLYIDGHADPHIWMDVSLWAQGIPYIVDALSNKDPSHAEEYRKRGQELIAALTQLHRQVRSEMQAVPASHRYLVTSHDAFNYFTRAYLAADGEQPKEWQERFAAPEGLAPDSQISPTNIQQIIDHLAKYKIEVIFPESNVNRDSIRKIVQAAKSKGIQVKIADVALYADAMGSAGSDADTYIKMVKHNAKAIAERLKPEGE